MQYVKSRIVVCALVLASAGSPVAVATAASRQQKHTAAPLQRRSQASRLRRHHRLGTRHRRHVLRGRIERRHVLRRDVLPADYGAWTRVADCESGGWRVLGAAYPDSLGINRTNWVDFGGSPMPPGPVSQAGQVGEIQVADRLVAHYHTGIPDAGGCGPW
ncbi:MAG TPA: hypothetical protein VFN36_04390 [Solirubrobacteraceae bacterium]|nr:hypothetical protein [Solirubrobacteraceae bacterium]